MSNWIQESIMRSNKKRYTQNATQVDWRMSKINILLSVKFQLDLGEESGGVRNMCRTKAALNRITWNWINWYVKGEWMVNSSFIIDALIAYEMNVHENLCHPQTFIRFYADDNTRRLNMREETNCCALRCMFINELCVWLY